jgi:DNA-binding transcriptional ArsR family regulator
VLAAARDYARDIRPDAAQRLPLAALRSTVIAPSISPLPTALALIAAALGDRGSPLRRELLGHLRERDVAALLPLRTADAVDGTGGRPNELVPAAPVATFAEQVEAVAALDPGALAEAVDTAVRAGHPAGPWRRVAAEPARWLRAYTEALRRAWVVLEPLWQRSAPVLDREVERISVALARGAGPELLARVYPQCAVAGEELLLPSHTAAGGPVRAGRPLLVYPLVAPPSAAGWTDDYGDVCLAVRYAIPGAWRALDGEGPPPASLAALLGPQRARMLLRLERPATAGELAQLLHAVPSMASHHLRALERAGLVTRTRDGRHVRVRRTVRGDALVTLYERG